MRRLLLLGCLLGVFLVLGCRNKEGSTPTTRPARKLVKPKDAGP